jgi:beta-lactamase regulating signal transducer with metallopeptidase domain/protocatechuate 3,4-dioxygenase beta subunit
MEAVLLQIGKSLLSQTWQIGVIFVLVAMVCWSLRRRSAHWRYLLWLVVLVKCLIPPVVTVPVAVLPAVTTSPLPVQLETPLPPQAEAPVAVMSPEIPSVPMKSVSLPQEETKEILPALSLQSWLVLGWIAGAGGFLMVALLRAWRMQSRFRRSRRKAEDLFQEEVEGLARQFKLRTSPKVWLIDGLSQPFVWGIFRGSIYLPANFSAAGTIADRQGIILHELAHVARFDALVNFMQVITQGLFFFHPLVWWANSRIRQEREKCCDEVAIARLGGSPRQYGSAIVETLVREYEDRRPLPSLAVAGSVKNIEDRVKTLMTPNKKFYSRPSRIAVASVLLLAALVVPTALVLTTRAEKKPNSNIERLAPERGATSNAQHRTLEKGVEQGTGFKAELSNGVMVELIGLAEHPSSGKTWWRPDGELLPDAPYAKINGSVVPQPSEKVREITIKLIKPSGMDVSFTWSVFPSGSNAGSGCYDRKGKWIENMWALAVAIPSDQNVLAVRFKAASGPWETRFESNGKGEAIGSKSFGGLVFSEAFETNGETRITVSHDIADLDFRVVAVDRNDKLVISQGANSYGYGKTRQATYKYANTPMAGIKKFLFQTRPYEWVTFSNVSLEPGKKTDVKIEVDKSNIQHSTSNIEPRTPEKAVSQDISTGTRIRGKVVEAGSGRPVAGALMVSGDGKRTTTDAKGEFVFEGMSADDHQVMAVKDDYARSPVRVTTASTPEATVNIELKPGGTIKGVVTDDTGKPVAGAEVRDYYSGKIAIVSFGWTKTDIKGEYEIKGYSLERPVWSMGASFPGLQKETKSNIQIPVDTRVAVVNFKLGKGLEITGRVVDEKGRPIGDALVAYGSSISLIYYQTARTNSQGAFRLTNLQAEKDLVVTQARGYAPDLQEMTPGAKDVKIVLKPGHFVAGRIVDRNKQPVKGIMIVTMAACPPQATRCSGPYRYLEPETRTDDQGRFQLESLPAEKVFIDIVGKSFSAIRVKELAVDKNDYEIAVNPIGHIQGQVLDAATGRPVQKFIIRLNTPSERKPGDIQAGFEVSYMTRGVTFQDTQGRFTISDLTTNGLVKVIAEAPGYTSAFIDRVIIRPAGDRAFDTVIKLDRGMTITGVVRNSVTKQPVAGAKVTTLDPLSKNRGWFSWEDDRREGYSTKQMETDAAGKFTIAGVNPVRMDVLITHPKYARMRLVEINFGRPDYQKDHVYAIDPAGSIEGTLYEKSGRPRTGVQVVLYLNQENNVSTGFGTVTVDEKGHYRFDHLPAGTYYLNQMENYRYTRNRQVTLKPGENQTVDFGREGGITLNGVVTLRGQPLAGLQVSVNDNTLRAVAASTTSDAEGRYEITGLEPKTYDVSFQKGEWTDPNKIYVKKTMTMKNPVEPLDIQAPAAGVSGVVRDAVTGKPVPGLHLRAYKRIRASELWSKGYVGTVDTVWSWQPLQDATTAANGTFALNNLAEGNYVFVTGDYNSRDKTATDLLKVKQDADLKDLAILSNQPGRLTVGVVDAQTGRPVPLAQVGLYTETGFYLHLADPKTKVQNNPGYSPPYAVENGRVTFEHLKPGKYSVKAGGSGYTFSENLPVEIPGRKLSELTVRLSPAARVVFKLIEPAGAPLTGYPYLVLRLSRKDGPWPLESLFGPRNGMICFLDGDPGKRSYRLDTLAEGRYQARIEVYRTSNRGGVNYLLEKPLFQFSTTFEAKLKTETVITVDMNAADAKR